MRDLKVESVKMKGEGHLFLGVGISSNKLIKIKNKSDFFRKKLDSIKCKGKSHKFFLSCNLKRSLNDSLKWDISLQEI